MRLLLATAIFSGIGFAALAGPHCTNEPESTWLAEAKFLEQIQPFGFDVKVFKKTAGNCYEIYGYDQTGKRVEVYFNPITAKVVKSSDE
jgi:hypothetical protein